MMIHFKYTCVPVSQQETFRGTVYLYDPLCVKSRLSRGTELQAFDIPVRGHWGGAQNLVSVVRLEPMTF